jgi:hypothetical protein
MDRRSVLELNSWLKCLGWEQWVMVLEGGSQQRDCGRTGRERPIKVSILDCDGGQWVREAWEQRGRD